MTDDLPRRAEKIFYECLERDPAARPDYLDEACDSAELRREVESLLAAHARGERAFRAPPSEPGASGIRGEGAPDLPNTGDSVEGRSIGGYELKRVLGRGGFGVVYEAEQRDPKRSVALKVMRGGAYLDEAGVRLFQREASALARLAHPGIAAIYEAGRTEDGEHFFAMELVRGRALTDHVRASHLSVKQKLDLFSGICDAIQYAHRRGVMHRDLKPGNILIDRDGNPKILDFGLAKITDTDVTLSTVVTEVGKVQGTLPYMSPEQARGEADAIDIRSDVYSLGVILYEMLTGALPYDVDRPMLHEAVRVICEEPPKRPSTISHVVRGDLETIVLKALAKEPERRYDSAAALADDIARYRTNQPISARPPSAGYQLRKLVARHKAPFAFAATVLGLVVAFGIWMSVLYARAESLRAEAEAARADAQARAQDLEEVARFQESMLRDLEPERVGMTLRDLIGKRIDGSDGGGSWERVNMTDVASELVEQEILDRAEATIESEFEDEPHIRGSLRLSLGNIMHDLGLLERAGPMLDSAVAARTAVYGEDDPRTLLAIGHRGNAYRYEGELERAESLLVPSHEGLVRALGPDHRDVVVVANYLAGTYNSSGKYEGAEALAKQVVETQIANGRQDDYETVHAMLEVGIALYWQGETEETREWYERSLAERERLYGPTSVHTLAAMHEYAALLTELGEFEKAIEYQTRALEGSRLVSGDEYRQTLTFANNLGFIHARMGSYADAEPLFRDVLEGRRKVLGPDHEETVGAMNNLGFVLDAQGKSDEAMPLYREALDGFRRRLGDEHLHTQSALLNLARVTFKAGRPRETLEMLEPTEEARRRLGTGSHSGYLARFLIYLGRSRAAVGRFEEAEEDLVEAREIYEADGSYEGGRAREVAEGFVELYDAWHRKEPDGGHDASATEWRETLASH